MSSSKIDYEKDPISKGEYTGSEWIFNRKDHIVKTSENNGHFAYFVLNR